MIEPGRGRAMGVARGFCLLACLLAMVSAAARLKRLRSGLRCSIEWWPTWMDRRF